MKYRAVHTPRLSELPISGTREALLALLGPVEHEQLDFKRKLPDDVTDLFAAMAMTDGGLVVLGVTDRECTVVGCPLDQKLFDAINRKARNVGIDVQVQQIGVDGTAVTVVAVPEVRERIITTPNGRLLRRVGSDNVPLVGDQMATFVTTRLQRAADVQPLPIVDLPPLDLGLINRALQGDDRPPVGPGEVWRALVDLGCANPSGPGGDPQLLAAGALLFAERPRDLVSGAGLQLVRRLGVGPAVGATAERRDVQGPLPALVAEVISFIDRHTSAADVVIGQVRERIPAYPVTVLREAVLNALAHRDYGLAGATVDVTVWDDRVEIQSPGGLPGHVTLSNIKEEHYSRNRVLMRVLKLLGLVEEYGEGVDRMFRDMEARLLDPPAIAPTPSSVTVVLRSRSRLPVEDQVWLQLLGRVDLSAAERLILVEARRVGEVSRRRASALSGSGDGEVLLRALVAKGLLRQIGQRGGSRYVLTSEVVMRAGATGVEASSRRREMLLEVLRQRGSLSRQEAAAVLDGDVTLARDLLKEFTAAGLVTAEGNTSARRYRMVP